MLVAALFVILFLGLIAWEDYKFRAVHWWLFILLFFGLVTLSSLHYGMRITLERCLCNWAFAGIQLLLLTLYFSLKEKRLVNVFNGYFGPGDLCFLISIGAYFPLINYVMFYVLSLLLVISGTLVYRIFTQKVHLKIPLAGHQAVCLTLLMVADFYFKGINFTTDFMVWNSR